MLEGMFIHSQPVCNFI